MKKDSDVIVNMNEKKKEWKSAFLVIFFLIWFMGSLAAMSYFAEYNSDYTIMIIGQFFLVFGSIPLFVNKGKDKLASVPFILIGLGCMIFPYLKIHSELFAISISWNSVINLLSISIFVIECLSMIIIPIWSSKILAKNCTVYVEAKISEYMHDLDEGVDVYCPIYSFKYLDKTYKVTDNFYSNFSLKATGDVVKLKINPDNPEEFVDVSSKNWSLMIVIGIWFLIFSVPLFIYALMDLKFVE